jgi:AmmeMemoRadiSam system protein B
MDMLPSLPKLRPCEIKRLNYQGQAVVLLRDFMLGDDGAVLVPWELRGLIAGCDGSNDIAALRSLCIAYGGPALGEDEVRALLQTLAQAGLLEGPQADAAVARALAAYHATPYRTLSHADAVYPADPTAATALLRSFELPVRIEPRAAEDVAGILSPHIDYARGGAVYAAGWRAAARAVRAAKRVIILGTDHKGGSGRLTLTRQRYATPWATFERDDELLEGLVSVLGEERAFGEELHHRSEHSIELAAVWLQHVRGTAPVTVLPVLCGYHSPWADGGLPGDDAALGRALELLRAAVSDGALVVVAGDLAHVGPEFGDERGMGAAERADVRSADEALAERCAAGANAVLAHAAPLDPRYRVCGLSPLALALAIMPPVRLDVAAYDQCAADAANASFVSVAGGVFVRG